MLEVELVAVMRVSVFASAPLSFFFFAGVSQRVSFVSDFGGDFSGAGGDSDDDGTIPLFVLL
jgi:hypothetical protein